MAKLAYETHSTADRHLPFIFGPGNVFTKKQGAYNWHENIELLQFTSGSGYIRCGSRDIPVVQGDIFVVNSNIPHSVCTDETLSFSFLIVDNAFFLSNGLEVDTLYFQEVIRDPQLDDLFRQVRKAYVSYDSQDRCAAADIRYAVLGVLRRLCRNYVTPPPTGDRPAVSLYVKQALAYIREHLASPLSLEIVSCHVKVSKFHLAREFKAYTGKTVVQAINLIRCTQARQMIERGSSVSEAAAACGYENLSYFSRTFKKLMGHSPSQCHA